MNTAALPASYNPQPENVLNAVFWATKIAKRSGGPDLGGFKRFSCQLLFNHEIDKQHENCPNLTFVYFVSFVV